MDSLRDDFIRCMVIDDDLDDHEIFSLALGETDVNAEVMHAYDGVDALQQLKAGEGSLPDFIFMDLNMPRMNGRECLAEIKKHERLQEIPVVIYSTSSEIRDLVDMQQLGAAAYIVKSPDIHDLTMALDDFMQKMR